MYGQVIRMMPPEDSPTKCTLSTPHDDRDQVGDAVFFGQFRGEVEVVAGFAEAAHVGAYDTVVAGQRRHLRVPELLAPAPANTVRQRTQVHRLRGWPGCYESALRFSRICTWHSASPRAMP